MGEREACARLMKADEEISSDFQGDYSKNQVCAGPAGEQAGTPGGASAVSASVGVVLCCADVFTGRLLSSWRPGPATRAAGRAATTGLVCWHASSSVVPTRRNSRAVCGLVFRPLVAASYHYWGGRISL